MDNRITPRELKARLEKGEALEIVDVREPAEYAVANLGGTHIPLRELPARLDEISREKDVVVLCHHGIRSAHAAGFLMHSGYTRVMNLVGGIDAWAAEVDPSMPRY